MKGMLAVVIVLILCCIHVAAAGQRTFISPLGDVNSVLGAQGKNIVVSENGEAIAIIYGDPTSDPQNPVEIKFAYSLDYGATWTQYGPFSGEVEHVYCAVDGSLHFDTNLGELFYVWSEHTDGSGYGDLVLCIEEGVPAASSPGVIPLGIQGVSPCIAVNPDNPQHVLITVQCSNDIAYAMISTDYGYTWSDTINMGITGAPHVRFGDSNYVFGTYHEQVDTLGSMLGFPFYVESMDGGYTWTSPEPLPVPFIDPDSSVFLSSQFDCEVIDNNYLSNTPVAAHFDIGTDSLWLFCGAGSPGSRIWDVLNVRELGTCSLALGDTFWYCYPSMYPSIALGYYRNVFGLYYKGFYLTLASGDTIRNGAHICGVHGWTDAWQITPPISEPNTGEIVWDDWGVTEVAHLMTEPPFD